MNVFCLGIDISKDKFDIALLINDKDKHKVLKNNIDSFERLIKWLESFKVDSVHACMESIGRYGNNLAKYLYSKNSDYGTKV